ESVGHVSSEIIRLCLREGVDYSFTLFCGRSSEHHADVVGDRGVELQRLEGCVAAALPSEETEVDMPSICTFASHDEMKNTGPLD
ncbi:hypothetical protein, partial [Streptomyces brasiliscabiei]|uniref:hypothetical protein n=1 Tax=Streptomyces brasiliscabiei TaxID=2736302 RepID=UPI001C125EAB